MAVREVSVPADAMVPPQVLLIRRLIYPSLALSIISPPQFAAEMLPLAAHSLGYNQPALKRQ